ncbi:FecCD family ABC transporter permease [Macrococcoides caseolyticum]|uniref:FecCD family ABC transporter permease n=1 Tax=Macrococcoides caseolyticum TaxID=69966 RepID=UPI001F169C22|nr:iron ABC transporter permease [Macrococcus caseolyticus]MCE4956464.1 iron ABC transporter permease [Macrococcus caseolyticus]
MNKQNLLDKRHLFSGHLITLMSILILLLMAMLILSFMLGVKNYSLHMIYNAIFNYQDISAHNIIRDIRIPREIAAMLVGMSLACGGAVMQGVTKNPLADPSLIGLNSGAALGISILFALNSGANFFLIILAGFVGAMVGGTIVLLIGLSKKGGFNPMRIILAGAAVSSLLLAFAEGIAIYFKTNQSSMLWSSGGVAGTTWLQLKYAAPVILFVIILILLIGHQLTVLSLGDEMAQGLGVNLNWVRVIFSLLTMILAGVAVAMAGTLAFVGLMVPHIARILVGVDYRKLLPVSTLLGGIFLVFADILARMLGESPVGAIISIMGVPFFIYLVRKLGIS